MLRIKIRKGQWPILLFNLIILAVFFTHFIAGKNYEFVLYVGVIVVFLGIFIYTNSRVYFPNALLWGLSFWALMHLAGGSFYIKGQTLYELMLVPISEAHEVFRYDQFVHIFGFAAATIVMFYVLKPLLRKDLNGWLALSIVVVAAGLGVGAFNEIVEFIATILIPETGVGGYLNTSLDLVANFIGAVAAIIIIRLTNKDIDQ